MLGSRNGSLVDLTWRNGELIGDPPTVDLVLVEAEMAGSNRGDRLSWAHIADPDCTLGDQPLADPASAWRLLVSVLDTVTDAQGDLPQVAVDYLSRPRPGRRTRQR